MISEQNIIHDGSKSRWHFLPFSLSMSLSNNQMKSPQQLSKGQARSLQGSPIWRHSQKPSPSPAAHPRWCFSHFLGSLDRFVFVFFFFSFKKKKLLAALGQKALTC